MYRRKSAKPPQNYIDPAELKAEVIASQTMHKCTDGLAQMLMEMHARIFACFPCFKGRCKQDVEDAQSYSLYRLLKCGIYTADPEKNLFSYFTTAIKMNGVSHMMKIDKDKRKQEELKKQILEKAAIEQSGYDIDEIQRRIDEEE